MVCCRDVLFLGNFCLFVGFEVKMLVMLLLMMIMGVVSFLVLCMNL